MKDFKKITFCFINFQERFLPKFNVTTQKKKKHTKNILIPDGKTEKFLLKSIHLNQKCKQSDQSEQKTKLLIYYS